MWKEGTGEGGEDSWGEEGLTEFLLLLYLVWVSLGPVLRDRVSALVMGLCLSVFRVCCSVEPPGL